MRTATPPPDELLRSRPLRLVDAEQDGERYVLLRPRFLRGLLARWLQPVLRRPYFRVHLDEIGSFVWARCDGETTVAELAGAMEEHFGARVSPALERLRLFLDQLQRGSMVRLHPPADALRAPPCPTPSGAEES